MDNTSNYIKKIIALAISAGIYYFGSYLASYFITLPVAFLVLSVLHYRITDEKPGYLYGLSRSEEFLNRKGGFWLLFKFIINLLGFVYDLFVWTFNGVYVLFFIIIDILMLIKIVIYWIIHAILWFLKLFVPPLIFTYKILIHYLILWPWWIYRTTFQNISKSVNKNFYFVSLWGSVFAILIIALFYGVGLLFEIPAVVILGIVFSILPLVWSYGEISAMRFHHRYHDRYDDVKLKFQSGFDAVRAVSFYLLIFLILLVLELIFNVLGWIPVAGFSLLGISLNMNTLASLLLLFAFVILLFAKFMLPPHVVIDKHYENDSYGAIKFVGLIGRNFLRYILSLIPAGFFSLIISIIPSIIILLAVLLSLNLKDSVIETRMTALKSRQYTLEGIERYRVSKKAERLEYLIDFPQNIFNDFTSLKELIENRQTLENNISMAEAELVEIENMFTNDIDSIQNMMNQLKNSSATSDSIRISRFQNTIKRKNEDFYSWKRERRYSIQKMQIDLKGLKNLIIQLPIAFFFSIIWFALFGGIILAAIVSYLGNVFYGIYLLKEDGAPTYFRQVLEQLNKKDKNQPLLGFTILIIFLVIIYFVFFGVNFISF